MGILHICIPVPAFTTPVSPKEIHFTDFWRFISGQQVMTLIQYTVLTVMVMASESDYFSIIFCYLSLNSHMGLFVY
jgi:hypothetical protein